MKNIITTLIFSFLFIINLIAQETSSSAIVDSIAKNPTKYLTPMEYAFMFHENTPWLIKAGQASDSRIAFSTSFERRIKNAFSVNLFMEYNITNSFISNRSSFLGLEARWYYQMKKRNENKDLPFNLSGNYLAIGGGYIHKNLPNYIIRPSNNYNTFFAKWGLQRRYLTSAYVDLGLNVNFNQFKRSSTYYQSMHGGLYAQLGFGFAKDQSKLNIETLCPVVKCQTTERTLLKTNIINAFNFLIFPSFSSINLSPNISLEHKFGNSSYSINTDIDASLQYLRGESSNHNGFRIAAHIEGRHYYNLKKRILRGKTGDAPSANYIALGIYNYYNESSLYVNNSPYKSDFSDIWSGHLQPQLVIGFQKLIADHFYYDVGIGYRPHQLRKDQERDFDRGADVYFSRLKIGRRF